MILQDVQIVHLVIAGLIGLVLGSFCNVLIYRIPLITYRNWSRDVDCFIQHRENSGGEGADKNAFGSLMDSVLLKKEKEGNRHDDENKFELPNNSDSDKLSMFSPRSHCPHCKRMIPIYWNIPILSYLILRGKCLRCHNNIGIRYLIVEVLGVLLPVMSIAKFGLNLQGIFVSLMSLALVVQVFLDIENKILSDEITFIFMWAAIILNAKFGLFTDAISSVMGAVIGYLTFWIIAKIFLIIRKKDCMGNGDFKLLAMFGACFGLSSILRIVLISSLVGGIVGIIFVIFKKHKYSDPIPFGPYLAIAGWIVCFFF